MSAENAKHLLECTHCQGKSCKTFWMKADVIKTMPDGRLKVRVYGRLMWKGEDHKSRIRYVEANRVTKRDLQPNGEAV